jgi:hypothetical protein
LQTAHSWETQCNTFVGHLQLPRSPGLILSVYLENFTKYFNQILNAAIGLTSNLQGASLMAPAKEVQPKPGLKGRRTLGKKFRQRSHRFRKMIQKFWRTLMTVILKI